MLGEYLMANITINEISQNYTYNIGNASYASVAFPITASWGPGYEYSNGTGLDLTSESIENSVWSRFAANQAGLEAFVATYRGPASQYLSRKDFSYQQAMTLLTAGYDVLVCRIAGGDRAANNILFEGGQSLKVTAKYPGTFGNSLAVTIKKIRRNAYIYWNVVTYSIDSTSGSRSAVENLNFVFDLERSTDTIPHISEVSSDFIEFDVVSAPTDDNIELSDVSDDTHSYQAIYGVQELILVGGTDHPVAAEDQAALDEIAALLADANSKKDAADSAKAAAVSTQSVALTAKSAAEAKLSEVNSAKDSMDSAKSEADTAKAEADTAKSAATAAKSAADAALAAFQEASSNPDTPPETVEQLRAESEEASAAYQAAKAEYDSKKSTYESNKAVYDSRKQTWNALKAEYSELQAAYEAAKAEYETAKAEYETAKDEYTSAKDAYTAAKTAYEDGLSDRYMKTAIDCAKNRFAYSIYSTSYAQLDDKVSIDDLAYIRLLGDITADKNTAMNICRREWMFNAAYGVLGALDDKLAYNPNRVIVPGWDDQDMLYLKPDLFNVPLEEREYVITTVSPLHQKLMEVAYASRCATAYIDVPRSLEKAEVYVESSDIASAGYAQKLARLNETLNLTNVNGAFYSSHSALFAPWGRYMYVGTGKQLTASPSFLALMIDRAMIRNQTSQYEWQLPTNRRHTLKIGKLDYVISKKYLDLWQSLEGVGVNCITTIPDLGVTVWGNSTLYEVPPATYQALANLSTRKLVNAVEDLAYRCGISITFNYNNEQAYNSFYAGMVPLLDTMRNVGAIEDYLIRMAEDVNGLDQVNANSVIGKIYLVIDGVINDINIDLIALPPATSLDDFRF